VQTSTLLGSTGSSVAPCFVATSLSEWFVSAASKDLSCCGSSRTALVFGVNLSQKCHSSTPCKFTHSILESQIERDAEMWSEICTYSTKCPHLCGAIEQKSDKPSEHMPPPRTLWLVHALF
jgi:hypothetical protein